MYFLLAPLNGLLHFRQVQIIGNALHNNSPYTLKRSDGADRSDTRLTSYLLLLASCFLSLVSCTCHLSLSLLFKFFIDFTNSSRIFSITFLISGCSKFPPTRIKLLATPAITVKSRKMTPYPRT